MEIADKKDTLYVTDADSTPQTNPGWPKGFWIGSAKTGKITGFVFDANAGEGVLVAPDGNLYVAVNVPPHGITKYAYALPRLSQQNRKVEKERLGMSAEDITETSRRKFHW